MPSLKILESKHAFINQSCRRKNKPSSPTSFSDEMSGASISYCTAAYSHTTSHHKQPSRLSSIRNFFFNNIKPFPISNRKTTTQSSDHNLRHQIIRRSSPLAMSSSAEPFELNDESEFQKITSPDGLLSICGFGSLLSERSARSTFPDLIGFRVARLNGFRRVFANIAPIFFERGIANPTTKETSSLCVEPCEGESLIVTVFDIKSSEIPAFIEREREFRFLAVLPETLEGKPLTRPAVLCSRFSDEEFFRIRCQGNKEYYYQQYGRFNIDKIWRDDILPCRVYLRHCVLAAKKLGDAAYNNFLDHTFLGDRKTTIREYLATTTGSGIMEEEPPELLKVRYGG